MADKDLSALALFQADGTTPADALIFGKVLPGTSLEKTWVIIANPASTVPVSESFTVSLQATGSAMNTWISGTITHKDASGTQVGQVSISADSPAAITGFDLGHSLTLDFTDAPPGNAPVTAAQLTFNLVILD